MVDLGRVIHLYDRWVAKLPRVRPFYAVKCNEDPALLKTLAALGTGFDCASKVRCLPDALLCSVPYYAQHSASAEEVGQGQKVVNQLLAN